MNVVPGSSSKIKKNWANKTQSLRSYLSGEVIPTYLLEPARQHARKYCISKTTTFTRTGLVRAGSYSKRHDLKFEVCGQDKKIKTDGRRHLNASHGNGKCNRRQLTAFKDSTLTAFTAANAVTSLPIS